MYFSFALPNVQLFTTSLTFEPVPGTKCKFVVNEPVMLLELVFDSVLDHSQANGVIQLTWKLDDVDLALPYTDGLHAAGRAAAGMPSSNFLSHRRVVKAGSYTAEVWWKTNNVAGTGASIRADLYPAEVKVELRSMPQTLGHGVDSKDKGVF